MANYAPLFTNIVKEESINALVVVGAQLVMDALSNPQTPKEVVRWIAKYAKNEGEIREACKTYAVFIASDPTMLPLLGDFSQAGETVEGVPMPTLAQVGTVMGAKLAAWAVTTASV